ncbi:MAG: hypothetical protein BIFFINMI_00802 [Phycisphaerae bacterium]|nr:hypothetical protein [Phycisphaerae bacterium]
MPAVAAKLFVPLAILALLPWPHAARAKDVVPLTDENVDAAIRKGVDYIWSLQNKEGHWEQMSDAQWKARKWDPARPGVDDMVRGGRTALALLGIIHGGGSVEDARFKKAANWLAEQDIPGTYALALRASLWSAIEQDVPAAQELLRKDALTLQNGIWPHGTYGYSMRPAATMSETPAGDFSNTQYGILGVWAGAEGGVEINQKYWLLVQQGYVWGQQKDGGWGYSVTPDHKWPGGRATYPGSRDGLTLGGIASLFVVWDRYYAAGACDGRRVDAELLGSLDAAIKWVGSHFSQLKKTGKLTHFEPYTLYCLERAGVASGLKYFGDFDWYREAAQLALNAQQDSGGWGTGHHFPECGTAWTIMFLAYGRAPVVFNKLAWGKLADWNSRPRDLANLTRWMGRTIETKFNWQIMPLDASAHDLQDAPILYISGSSAPRLTDEEKTKLRNFVANGGTLLFSPDGRGAATFARGVEALVHELFAGQELVPVPADSALFNKPYAIKPPAPMKGLNNGIRWTVLLSGVDLGCPWQQLQVVKAKPLFDLAANLYTYVSDSGQLKGRGHSYLPLDEGKNPGAPTTVGRLKWGSDLQSDPEPAAWAFTDVRLRNAGEPGVKVQATDLAQPLDPAAVPMLHVTGVGPIVLDDKAKANLKGYIEAGGVLLADAAGGDQKFAESFSRLMDGLLGEGALTPAPPAGDLMKALAPAGQAWYRHRFGLPRAQRPMEALVHADPAGRANVIFLPYDLSSAMVGYPSAAPVGLTPQSAEAAVSGLLKWLRQHPAGASPK